MKQNTNSSNFPSFQGDQISPTHRV